MCARQLCQASGSVWLKITADTTVFAPRRRSGVIIRGGLEARNKCPCVIDYTLQANEINRAWIDWVEITPEGQTSPRATAALTRWCSERRWRRSTLQFFFIFFGCEQRRSRPLSSSPTAHHLIWASLTLIAAAGGSQQDLTSPILNNQHQEKKSSRPSKGKQHQCCEATGR